MMIRNVALGVMNGEHHVDALLDTGATFSVIPSPVARILGFNKGNRLGTEWVDVVGSRKQMDRHRLEYVRVGSARVSRVIFIVGDLGASRRPIMLLGLTFLRSFNITLDLDRNVVLFRARAASK